MEILRTTRLVLRTWTLDDCPNAFPIWGDAQVMRFVDSGDPLTHDQVAKSIGSAIKHQAKFGYQHWAVIERASQKIIGACGFNSTDLPGEIELVFHFAKAFWGKGYASEAAKACVDYAIKNLKPTKIIAGCHPDNESSIKVLRKVGLALKGTKWFDDTKRDEPYFELMIRD